MFFDSCLAARTREEESCLACTFAQPLAGETTGLLAGIRSDGAALFSWPWGVSAFGVCVWLRAASELGVGRAAGAPLGAPRGDDTHGPRHARRPAIPATRIIETASGSGIRSCHMLARARRLIISEFPLRLVAWMRLRRRRLVLARRRPQRAKKRAKGLDPLGSGSTFGALALGRAQTQLSMVLYRYSILRSSPVITTSRRQSLQRKMMVSLFL